MADPELHARNPGEGMRRLEALMAVLRGPEGCPWDREQTLTSLKSCLVEEAYELLDVMDGGELESHREELGDVLLQVVFQAQIRKEQGAFALDDVAHGIAEKLIRRHPHVFGNLVIDNAVDVLRTWEAIKRREGRADEDRPRSPLAGVPASLPALLRAQRVQSKCAKAGLDRNAAQPPHAAVAQALEKLETAARNPGSETATFAFGELLFALVGMARTLGIDAEDSLRSAVGRFAGEFLDFERTAGGGDSESEPIGTEPETGNLRIRDGVPPPDSLY